MVWRVPVAEPADQTYELDVWGNFGKGRRGWCGSYVEERSLVSKFQHMTQRLQETFYISACPLPVENGRGGSRDRATHPHYPDRTGYRGRVCSVPQQVANRFIFWQ